MILDYLNFPMLNRHRQVCKYGPYGTTWKVAQNPSLWSVNAPYTCILQI